MASRSPPLSAAWRQGPCLALRSRHQDPTTTLTRTNPSFSGRIVTSGANASGTDGVGAYAVWRIATDAGALVQPQLTIGAEAPVILSSLARRFDLSVFMQTEPDGVD